MRVHGRGFAACLTLCLLAGLSACGDDNGTAPVDEAPSVTLTAPATATAVQPGEALEIKWVGVDDGTLTADLSYIAEGVSETTIATGLSGGSHVWTTPTGNLLGLRVKVTVTDESGQQAEAESGVLAVVAHSQRGYVTAQVCSTCHEDKADELFDSGHPYKLSKVTDGQPPSYPFTEVPSPPTGFSWNDISYVIGGYGWKARFMDKDGYVLVTGLTGVPVQYNLPRPDLGGGLGAEWVDYHASDTEPKPYTCGTCHTTGWQTTAENGGVHQDGLVGIAGTWEEPGVTCEACHGAGLQHVASKSATKIDIDVTAELCGSCHFRDTNHNILARGGFIRHHEQYDEVVNGAKASFSCIQCHEPHIGVRHGNADKGGIVSTCESCHPDKAASNSHVAPVDCATCHMPRASKSARKVHDAEGDVRTHIFTINAEPFPKDSMFFVDPTSGSTHTRGFVTLDFACYTCHQDGAGNGGTASVKTLTELSARAKGIHN